MLSILLISCLSTLFLFTLFYSRGTARDIYSFYIIILLVINLLVLSGQNFIEEYFMVVTVLMVLFFVVCIIWSKSIGNRSD